MERMHSPHTDRQHYQLRRQLREQEGDDLQQTKDGSRAGAPHALQSRTSGQRRLSKASRRGGGLGGRGAAGGSAADVESPRDVEQRAGVDRPFITIPVHAAVVSGTSE